MIHLKDKIDAKADFIITQAIFDNKTFQTFQNRCRSFGIEVPIVPGIFAFTSQKSLLKMSQFCDIMVPQEVSAIVEQNKHNAMSVYNFGIHFTTELIKNLLTAKKDPIIDVHLFTLNNIYAVYEICERLGFCTLNIERPLKYVE
ncbi:methylenetetrahydrofolate reductase 1-like [Agrilus planipennis]|uniref:Methylenetetrahydrofolate reductase 1 n=1 Tax=Agrilus planipennis TaxID=224129 RepID=A0A7F5R8V7_AGRPL|nr:methylenetetrahydrofolate reductase 1 [Agrilus planipennis]XP_025836504.1 methylenetetrahydrofolate reductase 1-like [Agrilus planipennis]